MLPAPSSVAVGAGVAGALSVEVPNEAVDVSPQEGRQALPSDAHGAIRLKGRKPKRPRK